MIEAATTNDSKESKQNRIYTYTYVQKYLMYLEQPVLHASIHMQESYKQMHISHRLELKKI